MNRSFLLSTISLSLLIFCGTGLSGQNSPRNIPMDKETRKIEDDSSLRISLEASWFREAPGNVLAKKPEIYTLKGGSVIQVRAETSPQNRDEFAVVLARQYNGAYPGWAQGSWVLTRRRDDNPEGSRIMVFLRSDYNTYVQFRPFSDEKCLMDVVLYDAYAIRSLPIPIPFERLYVLPVEDVLRTAGERFPRRYFDPSPDLYRDSRTFTVSVRSRLPELKYLDDGAIDENGDYVFIRNLESQNPSGRGLNCSGFAKWVVDGILRPHTGKRLSITRLKKPFGDRGSSYTEIWEQSRNPFFGLDWNRNLASEAGMLLRSPSFGTLEEIEVRDWPFSQVVFRRGTAVPAGLGGGFRGGSSPAQPGAGSSGGSSRPAGGSMVYPYPGYVENAGFGFEGLHALLYSLAIDEPGRIYLAAVNNEIGAKVTPENPRGLPRIRQFYHTAVLVPYFSERGNFQVAVFESAAETSFNRFKTRYPGQFVNLVRIPIDGSFEP